MLPLERRQKIIEQISTHKAVKVIDLSREFAVTEETIRRDLEKLEQEGILIRTYGGAVLVKRANEELPLSIRLRENMRGKRLIGQIIASLVQEGDVIMMGTGTTNLEFARKINHLRNITVITNSLGVISEVVQNDAITVVSVGGTLIRKTLAFVGPAATATINGYYADKAIISCKAVNREKGIMESSEIEVEIKRAMVKSAKEVILAVDHTKFDSWSMIGLFDFRDIDLVVTDIKPSKDWMEFFKKMNIECLYQL